MRKLAIALTLVTLTQAVRAQDTLPLLTGTVHLSILQGTMDCDLTLSDIPRIQDYLIRINSGMNIRYFRSVKPDFRIYYDKSITDSTSSYETCSYYFSSNQPGKKFLPKALRFRYVGMYPVITDTTNESPIDDWKGNIAFNGYSVRMDGYQSCWYPVLYDIKHDKVYEKVRYDLEVDCPDCSVIYINGSAPVQGTHAHLTSETPRELMMYSGKYAVANEDGTFFLNPDLDAAHLKALGAATGAIKHYYEQHLNIPYKDTITYIQTTPTAKDRAWLFVSYPSIVNIGFGQYGMMSFADPKRSGWFKTYIAHELGHYYFGTVRRFNAGLGDMMSEGFAEFLSLHAAKNLMADSIYHQLIDKKIKALKAFSPVAFAQVKTASDYHNRELYVYYYAPLIFTAIEKEIGEKNSWLWMHELLATPTDFTDYAFLLKTLGTVLKDQARLDALSAKYFDGDKTLANALAETQNEK